MISDDRFGIVGIGMRRRRIKVGLVHNPATCDSDILGYRNTGKSPFGGFAFKAEPAQIGYRSRNRRDRLYC